MTRVSPSEFARIKRLSSQKAAKRAEKRATLPWGKRIRSKVATGVKRSLGHVLDDLWSFYVKLRDRKRNGGICRICGRNPISVAYHVLQRGYRMIRWDVENGVGACSDCNWWEVKTRQQNPQAVRDRHIKIFGLEMIELLERKKNAPGKLDKLAIKEHLQSLIRKMAWEKS